MRGKMKRIAALVICATLMFALAFPVDAANNNSIVNSRGFKDVPKGHWAYDEIMWMFERKIIEGIGNNVFNPNGIVTRAEFAKMMVLTLDLEKYSPDTPSFLDVKKKDWAYPYVESAKRYLTGFRTSGGDYYYPSRPAVREDMAVALVTALGYQGEDYDENLLRKFTDSGQINPNLRKHVALAVKYGLMQGYNDNTFKPQGNLTRAEAAKLLYRAFKSHEEKVTYDEEKVTYDELYAKPTVSVSYENGKTVVRWNKIESPKLLGYAVVISKNDSTPQYPENGLLYYITDRDRTNAVVDNSTKYTGTNDFDDYLKKDEKYYFSVSAVYTDKVVAGNAVRKAYNGTDKPDAYVAPTLSASIENGKLVLRWNKIDSKNLNGYKVVASKSDSTPSYPENGYLYYITDRNKNYAVIDNSTAYNDGDFGKYFVNGEKYYFAITAVYKDRNVTGNVIRQKYEGKELFPAPVVSTSIENGKLVLRWNKIDSENLRGYRVVASKNDSTPSYPENGYLYKITDLNRNYAVIDNSTAYNDGDFGKYFVNGEKYYFSVTAIYKDRNVTGNVIRKKYEGKDSEELFPAPVISADYEDGILVVKWNKIDSPYLAEYKVVISKGAESPAYPANGYYGTYDKDTTSADLSVDVEYKDGDFSRLEDGTEYYISVTAVYSDNKYVAGNAVKKLFLLPPE